MMTVFAGMSVAILTLAPITSPIGSLVVFAGLTAGDAPAVVCPQAWKTGIHVFAILAVLTVSDSLIICFFGFDPPSLQITGGLIVTHSGFSVLESKRRTTHEETQHATSKPDVSFSPMVLPPIAGSGSVGVVIALAIYNTVIGFHAGIVLGIAVTTAAIVLLSRCDTPWIDELGATGIGAIVRIMGFLIPVISVELIIHGVRTLQLL